MSLSLQEGYARMAADVEREAEALEWAEALMTESLGGQADDERPQT